MQPPFAAAEILDHVLAELNLVKPLIPTYIHLLASALFSIYTGAFASLSRPSSAAKPSKKNKETEGGDENDSDNEEEGEEVLQRMEGLEPSDAIVFPLFAGLMLAGLYFLIKFLEDPAVLNVILNWYFAHAGFFFMVTFVKDALAVLRSFIFPLKYSRDGTLWKADQKKRVYLPISKEGGESPALQPRKSPLPGIPGTIPLPASMASGLWTLRDTIYRKATLRARIRSIVDLKSRFTILDVVSVLFAVVTMGAFVLLPRPWWMTNFLGFCFCYGALQFMSPTTFWTGTLLLGSLFFYDVYFVFFTPMMVTVAQKLDVPIKLLFPRPPTPEQDPDVVSLAMLGLGDIVVPGTMIGLALRFDLYLYYLRNRSASPDDADKPQYLKATGGWGERFWARISSIRNPPEKDAAYHNAKAFPITYFRSAVFGYAAGMVATLIAMQISSHPQPALLYLVPGVVSSIWMTAYVKGDVRTMWDFSDDAGDGDDDEKRDDEQEKEEDKPNQGMFSKIFFGTSKSDSKQSSSKKDGSQKGEKQTQEKTQQQEKSSSSVDIIFFTISLPQSQQPEQAKEQDPSTPTPGAQELQSTSQDSTSGSSSPVMVDRDPPRASKRRKEDDDAQDLIDLTD